MRRGEHRLFEPGPLFEASTFRPFVCRQSVQNRVGQAEMRGLCRDDIADVGQLLSHVLRICDTKFSCFFKQFVDQRLSRVRGIEIPILRCAACVFDDRWDQITNEFFNAQ